mgnify:CR=1 FL=1
MNIKYEYNTAKLNPSQLIALKRIKEFMLPSDDSEHFPDTPQEIHSVTICELYAGVFSLAGQVERLALPETNLLRAIDHGYYHFFIGKRGAVTVKSAPSSYDQFNNKRAFGFTFKNIYS